MGKGVDKTAGGRSRLPPRSIGLLRYTFSYALRKADGSTLSKRGARYVVKKYPSGGRGRVVAGGAADSGDQGRHALITTAMMGMIKQLIMKFRFSTHVRAPWVKKTLIVSAIPQVGILDHQLAPSCAPARAARGEQNAYTSRLSKLSDHACVRQAWTDSWTKAPYTSRVPPEGPRAARRKRLRCRISGAGRTPRSTRP